MRRQCIDFHEDNPRVWELFKKFTFDRVRKGFHNYSARSIFHRIRWETDIPEYEQGEEFKLNDHHSPFYARRFMRMYPEHAGFFRTRIQKSQAKPATNRPEIRPEVLA